MTLSKLIEALFRLAQDTYSTDEVRIVARHLDERLPDYLPGRDATHAAVISTLVDELIRRGIVNEFIAKVREDRPNRHDIQAIEQAWFKWSNPAAKASSPEMKQAMISHSATERQIELFFDRQGIKDDVLKSLLGRRQQESKKPDRWSAASVVRKIRIGAMGFYRVSIGSARPETKVDLLAAALPAAFATSVILTRGLLLVPEHGWAAFNAETTSTSSLFVYALLTPIPALRLILSRKRTVHFPDVIELLPATAILFELVLTVIRFDFWTFIASLPASVALGMLLAPVVFLLYTAEAVCLGIAGLMLTIATNLPTRDSQLMKFLTLIRSGSNLASKGLQAQTFLVVMPIIILFLILPSQTLDAVKLITDGASVITLGLVGIITYVFAAFLCINKAYHTWRSATKSLQYKIECGHAHALTISLPRPSALGLPSLANTTRSVDTFLELQANTRLDSLFAIQFTMRTILSLIVSGAFVGGCVFAMTLVAIYLQQANVLAPNVPAATAVAAGACASQLGCTLALAQLLQRHAFDSNHVYSFYDKARDWQYAFFIYKVLSDSGERSTDSILPATPSA